MRFGPSQLCCLGSSAGRALCLDSVMGSSPTRGSSFFLGKLTALGCAVLLCLVCLFDLACFFLSSFSSLIKNMCIQNLPHQFAVQYKARNNKDVIRDDIITALASLVTRNGDYSHTVDLSNPDLTVVVEIIKVNFNNLIIIYIHVQ